MELTKKFLAELGSLQDFVDHLKSAESRNKLSELGDFIHTSKGTRYLMLKGGGVPIVDFRHFFAAMMQRLEGGKMKSMQGEGETLFLGIMNEVFQCVEETTNRFSYNSCFSPEDLGSNRLGVEFSELVTVKRAEANKTSMALLLNSFLSRYNPVPATEVEKLKAPSAWNNAREIATQIIQIVSNVLVPKAY